MDRSKIVRNSLLGASLAFVVGVLASLQAVFWTPPNGPYLVWLIAALNFLLGAAFLYRGIKVPESETRTGSSQE